VLRGEMRGNDVIIVSNREPYIHVKTKDGIKVQHPASGLVTALEPVMRACSGTWIAHGSGNADRETVDRNDRVAVPPDSPAYHIRRLWLSDSEVAGYYEGFANEGLWPLCHIAHVRPIVPRRRLGAVPRGQRQVRRCGGAGSGRARIRWSWCRTTTSRSCRA
jgi:trehalose 6-phosphate synthase